MCTQEPGVESVVLCTQLCLSNQFMFPFFLVSLFLQFFGSAVVGFFFYKELPVPVTITGIGFLIRVNIAFCVRIQMSKKYRRIKKKKIRLNNYGTVTIYFSAFGIDCKA